jgi:hypothetical protein
MISFILGGVDSSSSHGRWPTECLGGREDLARPVGVADRPISGLPTGVGRSVSTAKRPFFMQKSSGKTIRLRNASLRLASRPLTCSTCFKPTAIGEDHGSEAPSSMRSTKCDPGAQRRGPSDDKTCGNPPHPPIGGGRGGTPRLKRTAPTRF